MVSAIDGAKRELVKLLRVLAGVFNVALSFTRDASAADVAPTWSELFEQHLHKTCISDVKSPLNVQVPQERGWAA
jgi:hypothetical protein